MTTIVNIHEATTHLSRIIDEVAAGAEVIIAREGKPLAKPSPLRTAIKKKKFGVLKGKIEIPEDFNAPLAGDVLPDFEGG
jgi:antitoxin (DNA-binding transcriptional repressor) of toxin-antitoxin stability system